MKSNMLVDFENKAVQCSEVQQSTVQQSTKTKVEYSTKEQSIVQKSRVQTDMENVMSKPSAASVNLLGWGKIPPVNIHFFVVFTLTVAILSPFQCNPVGKLEFNGKRGKLGN